MLRLKLLIALGWVFLLLSGCTSYSSSRYGDDGIYGSYERVQVVPAFRSHSAHYPYWSLDHFYFSQFYSPFSVVVHPWDPWLFPYSAWYWNYPYSHGAFLAGGPWYNRAPWSLHGYHSWRYHRPYWHDPRYHRHDGASTNYRGRRVSAGRGSLIPMSTHQNHRLERLERQRSIRTTTQPVTRRSSSQTRRTSRSESSRRASTSRPASRPTRARAHPRNRPPAL